MNKKILLLLIVGLGIVGILIFVLVSFPVPEKNQPDKVSVVASFYPLYFFAKEIGQDKIDIINITPAGAEPHEYEPTPQDIVHLQDSRLIILNGAGFEPWSENIKQNLKNENIIIIEVGNDLANREITEEEKTIKDPHIWLNPQMAKVISEKIAEALKKIDPENTDFYQSNATYLKEKLDNLDNQYQQALGNCLRKDIVTSHEAFGYLASRYGLNQVPISGISPEQEPSSQQLIAIAKFIKENKIKHIFFESLLSPKLSDTLSRETGAETLELNPIEGLTDDEISEGKDYFTKMQQNLVNLKIALQCK